MSRRAVHISVLVMLFFGGLACGLGSGSPAATEGPPPTTPPAPTNTSEPPSPQPTVESETGNGGEVEEVDYDTVFPLPDNVQNFMGEGGESQINFQTSLTMDEVIAFYRRAFAEMDLSEYDILTVIEDEAFSMVFTGWPTGEELVIQGVVFADSTNVNIRLEEVVGS